MTTRTACIVVGAGIAGLSTAVRLSDAGLRVHVIEAADVIGGRAADWNDNGMRVDAGLHRYLGFYRHLPRLLRHAGVPLRDVVTWTDAITFARPGRAKARYWASPLRQPCRTIGSLLGNTEFLPWGQRAALVRMLVSGATHYYRHPDELDRTSLSALASRHRVNDETLHRLVGPVTAGRFGIPPSRFSAFNFMGLVMPYLPAMLKTGVGAFSGGMTEVMCEPLAAYIRHRGGIVTTGVRAQSLLGGSSAITGVLTDHGELEAGHVVVATSPGPATALIDSALTNHPFFDGMRALPTTPTVSFQAETTRPLLQDDSPLFAPGTEIEFLAEQSRTTFPESTGRLSVTMARPDQVWDLSTGELATLVTREAARVGIYLDGQILDARTVRTNDFYDLGVGHEHLRPPQHTPVPGLTLAGDYTRQRYLATMEGATFSGELAARSVLGRAT